MQLFICDDSEKVAQKAAEIIEDQLRAKPDSVLGLATGNTPLKLYQELIKLYQTGQLDFSQIKTFNLDEFLVDGLDQTYSEHPALFKNYMQKNFFSKVNIPTQNINLLPSKVQDSDQAAGEICSEFENKISASGGIELQILGIGRNAHIAFNEPGSSFSSLTRQVDLAESTIVDTANEFGGFERVPKKALTMGIKTILSSKMIILMASGQSKAQALKMALEGAITEEVPASVLKNHEQVIYIVDRKAASLLTL
jgi:glucosamine-6-phosphate deaminase